MIRAFAFLAVLFAFAPTQVNAQASVILYCLTTQAPPNQYQPCSSTWPLQVSSSGGGGGSVTQGTTPWVDNITQWASVSLGAATAWGTAPSGNVPGVNANILGPLGQQLSAASIPVVLPAAQITTLTPPTSVTANGAANVTATDCSGTVTSGGTAQNAFTAQTTLHGFTIVNIDTTEPLWISFTTTAVASGSGSYPLPAATATTFAGFGSFTSPPGFGLNHALSVIAATTSHKFTCTWW